MKLEKLSLVNYKNIALCELQFSPKINCLLGNNGMGKTNLLDAIYYLSFCRSFSNLPDTQNMLHGSDFFMIQGKYEHQGEEEEVLCGMKRGKKKQFKRNKKEYERFSDHIGLIPLVMISPSDGDLISGGSEERRRFLDMVIAQHNTSYLNALIAYNKALAQRNALLKMETTPETTLFEIWEEQMVQAAEQLFEERTHFLTLFNPLFQQFYSTISQGIEEVSLTYISDMKQGNLSEQLLNSRQRDTYLGHTTKGIHRDDLEMLLGEYPIRKIGSQGQNKTFLIALKFAQFAYLQQLGVTTPLLLLDDIFDKLDDTRVEQIIRMVSGNRFGQIFITDTNRVYLDSMVQRVGGEYAFFEVNNGNITAIDNVQR